MRAWTLFALLAWSGPASAGDAERLFREAAMRREDAGAARRLFGEAARAFAEEDSVADPDAALNAARACYLAGRLPEAVQLFHRGLALAPTDSRLQRGLSVCREAVSYPAAAPPEPLAEWRHRVAPLDLLALSLLASLLALGGVFRHTVRPGWPGRALIGLGLLVWAAVGVLFVTIHQEQRHSALHPVRVLQSPATLRTGNGASYPARLDRPLPPGFEVRVLHRRGGWVQVRLSPGTVGWLPEADLLADGPPG